MRFEFYSLGPILFYENEFRWRYESRLDLDFVTVVAFQSLKGGEARLGKV